jgi:SAM-dependent methyltransferase
MKNLKSHWENIYSNSKVFDFPWIQEIPTTSLLLIYLINLPKNAKIIDIGGGDSFLVDHLINLGFTNISVLDISENAINNAKKRLGENSKLVQWFITDIKDFQPNTTFDLWHDRATFHFLKSKEDIETYYQIANQSICQDGHLILSSFSDNGPKTCSELEVTQYNKKKLTSIFERDFNRIKCIIEDHITPSNSIQNFIFCLFKKHPNNIEPNHNQDEDEYILKSNSLTNSESNLSCDINNKGKCCR